MSLAILWFGASVGLKLHFGEFSKRVKVPKWPLSTQNTYLNPQRPYLTLFSGFKGGQNFKVLWFGASLGLKLHFRDFLTRVKKPKMALDDPKVKKGPPKPPYPPFLPKLRGVMLWNFFATTSQKKVGHFCSNFRFSGGRVQIGSTP